MGGCVRRRRFRCARVGRGDVRPYGVRKYIANAKTAEARNSLGQIAKDAAAAVEREKGTTALLGAGGTSSLMRMFCRNCAGLWFRWHPQVHAQKYQSTKADWSSSTDNTVGWQCLKFSIDEPQYYQYQYTAAGTDANSGGFTANAFGDLNGDSVESTFSVMGSSLGAEWLNDLSSPNVQETDPEE